MVAKALGGLLMLVGAAVVLYLAVVLVSGPLTAGSGATAAPSRAEVSSPTSRTLAQGRQIFRFDTFGDEAFWGGALQLHQRDRR